MARSYSIPITQGISVPDEHIESQHHAILADYKDYVFYHRIVKGMRMRQDRTRDIALRYENQALIDHIIRMRHAQEPSLPHPRTSIPSSENREKRLHRVKSRADLLACLDQISLESDDEWGLSDNEDLIFDIDI